MRQPSVGSLGSKVNFDPKTETFINDEEANKMANRVRREPWTPDLSKLPKKKA